MKAGIIIGAIEAVALALGFLLWHFGLISGWIVPFFLLLPPVLAVVVCIVFFAGAQGRGENPFQ